MTSIGSTPLPSDLDILRFCSSRTKPCKSTSENGFSPVCSRDEKIMRATQKKIMSYPVTKTFVGKYFFKSAVSSGHPIVENGHKAIENQISNTSSSQVTFSGSL